MWCICMWTSVITWCASWKPEAVYLLPLLLSTLNTFYFILSVWYFVCTCHCTMFVQCLWGPAEGVRYPRTGVTDGSFCSPMWVLESKSRFSVRAVSASKVYSSSSLLQMIRLTFLLSYPPAACPLWCLESYHFSHSYLPEIPRSKDFIKVQF